MTVRIGVTSGAESGAFVSGWPLVYTVQGIIAGIERQGALPVVLPTVERISLYGEYVDMLDGLIVTGEVKSIANNPFDSVQGSPVQGNVLETGNPLRYKNETEAIREALKKSLPILAICRGYQVLNVVEGGRVGEEDITQDNAVVHHQGTADPADTSHTIRIVKGTKLHRIMQTDTMKVNSFHRQAVKQAAPGYVVSAVSEDGSIEAVESNDERFIIGVQFHPEMLRGEQWQRLFKALVQASEECSRKFSP